MKFSIIQGITIMAAGFVMLAFVLTEQKPSHAPAPESPPQLGVPAPGFEGVDEKVVVSGSEDAEEVDTSDWVEYRNEELGFRFRYPAGWETFGVDQGSTWFNQSLSLSHIPHADTSLSLPGDIRGTMHIVKFSADPRVSESDQGQLSLDDWFTEFRLKQDGVQEGPEFSITTRNATLERTTIDGREAYLQSFESVNSDDVIAPPRMFRELIVDGGSSRALILQFHSPLPIDEGTRNIIDSALATFEFID